MNKIRDWLFIGKLEAASKSVEMSLERQRQR